MSRGSRYSRLHHLINDSISPYTEAEVVSLTREQEKELLDSLSQISKQLQLWTREAGSDSGDQAETHSDDHLYVSKIIADMVFLLAFKSHYVQHLAANILVVISKLLATSGIGWDLFIWSLCCCMELAVTNILSFSSTFVRAELGNPQFNSSGFAVVIKPRLKNAGWSSLAGIVRVLRHILKFLKQDYDYDDNLTAVYEDSVHSCLSNVPWDSMDVICGNQSGCSDLRTVDGEESRPVFLGNFIQLLCSLVEESSSMGGTGFSPDKHPIFSVITNLVPKLLRWCLADQGECVKTRLSQYFRHKLLVLMIRLSFQLSLDCCTLISWLQLLHSYFEELLQQPITHLESVDDDCLEGSPFLMSVTDGELYSMCSRHLQRQAIFLFVRCSLTLIGLRKDNRYFCTCATADTCFTFESISDLDCCGRKKGLLEFNKWLQGHVPIDTIENYEIYMEKCINFSSSFLQLYIHEDDILFKVLLQFLTVPFSGEQRFDQKLWTFKDVEEDILFHLSHLFNPVHVFHLVLAELHYDHQVLLDYLISKDTGIPCAEYLLRCLRMVCDSWPLFKEFSPGGKSTNQSSGKRRKVVLHNPNLQGGLPSATSENILPCLEKEFFIDIKCGYDYKSRRSYYEEAKDCLLSLKTSVDNLHQKNLFLYNPQVLLKRLKRFQELCS